MSPATPIIASLRKLFATFNDDEIRAQIDEYSDTNIRFHQRILELAQIPLLTKITDGLFIHMQAIRARTISEADRASRSIVDHCHIIKALEVRDAELAERLVREHTLNLYAHVEQTWVEPGDGASPAWTGQPTRQIFRSRECPAIPTTRPKKHWAN